jgi:hypothetical protein
MCKNSSACHRSSRCTGIARPTYLSFPSIFLGQQKRRRLSALALVNDDDEFAYPVALDFESILGRTAAVDAGAPFRDDAFEAHPFHCPKNSAPEPSKDWLNADRLFVSTKFSGIP